MKKFLIPFIIFNIIIIDSSAQNWYNKYYSDKNLSELNYEELYFLHDRSSKMSGTGLVLTVVGSGLAFTGGAMYLYLLFHDIAEWESSGDLLYGIAFFSAVTGVGMSAVGIPVLGIGLHRKKTIDKRINDLKPPGSIGISPSIQSVEYSGRLYPGLSIKIYF